MKRLSRYTRSVVGSGLGNNNHDNLPPQPPRYKMVILMTGVIFLLLQILVPKIRQLTIGLPNLISTFAGVAIMVVLMSYVIIPALTRLLRSWLIDKNHI
jgi:antibiotic biosynthesis monooxygenase (ABM) superfamily enzyme